MMDPLKLLSRSTKLSKKSHQPPQKQLLPSAQESNPQLFHNRNSSTAASNNDTKKRKRDQDGTQQADEDLSGLDFFGGNSVVTAKKVKSTEHSQGLGSTAEAGLENGNGEGTTARKSEVKLFSEEDRKRILRSHKIKVTWVNPSKSALKASRKSSKSDSKKQQMPEVYPQPLKDFNELSNFGVSRKLQENVRSQGYSTTTEVQLAGLSLLLQQPDAYLPTSQSAVDLLTVAPTGSGKTLVFLIPLFTKISRVRRSSSTDQQRHTSALILAPTKELVGQIVNEGRKLAPGTGIRIAQVRKGMNIQRSAEDNEDESGEDEEEESAVKADILVSTPGVLHSMIAEAEGEQAKILPAVNTLVMDEADVLLDPLFREQTLTIWRSLPNADLRVSLWSATMGSNIEELARSTLKKLGSSKDRPLLRLVVGLKDTAVPNIEHKLIYAATEQGKLMGLRQLLHPASTSAESGPALRPPFLVFTQTIERAVALHSELLYDIPAEAGGISRIAVLHSDLSDTARDSVMTRFRKGEVWILITTDLLSRGVDFRGVNGVVNYDIPTSPAAYIHRVGRTGRAGREGGVAVTLYSKEDIQYLRPIANVIAAAQKQKGVEDGKGIQQWLLDALPVLSKNDKQKFKKHGIEARTSRGMAKDPRAATKARISTKSGYVRKEENRRKGAILGSRRRAQAEGGSDNEEEAADAEAEFGGFD